jgi:hypothetical protein
LVIPGRCGVIFQEEERVQVQNNRIVKVEIRVVPFEYQLPDNDRSRERSGREPTELLNVTGPANSVLLQLPL